MILASNDLSLYHYMFWVCVTDSNTFVVSQVTPTSMAGLLPTQPILSMEDEEFSDPEPVSNFFVVSICIEQ